MGQHQIDQKEQSSRTLTGTGPAADNRDFDFRLQPEPFEG
jgi:hypothetical protein